MSEDMTNHEAVEFLKNMIGEESGRAIGKDGFFVELMGYHVQALKKGIAALEAEMRTAHWIQKDKGDGFINWRCSNCGMLSRSSQRPWYKFCPDCGARMEVT